MPKAAVPEKKVPEAIPPKPESPPPAGNDETLQTSILEKKNCLLSVVKMILQNVLYV